MPVVSCDGISLSYGAAEILKSVSFSLNEGERLGIVGVNGAGKTSLVSILSGGVLPSSGTVSVQRGRTLGVLHQNAVVDSDRTVLEEAFSVFSSLIEEEKQVEALRLEAESDETRVQKYVTAMEEFGRHGGYEFRGRVNGILRHLGFGEKDRERRVNTLSGGQKTRPALSLLLMSAPDILILDEPTNHLDVNAMFWLESTLKKYGKTVIVVSHDRYFLDAVCGSIFELENGRGKLYRGNYSEYRRQKSVDREIQLRHYENQQREIRRQEAYIEQQRRWNRERNIVAAESRQKLLDKMVLEEKPENLPRAIKMFFPLSGESGNDVLTVSKLSKSYGGKTLFRNFSLLLKKRDRLFITGPNGCGKSTLLKIIAGRESADCGFSVPGANVIMGYYDQENRNFAEGGTVIDELWNTYPSMTETDVRSALALFNFRGDDVFKPVSVLSGGERARLTVCKLVLKKTNLLVLDEPTNHLDIQSREVLENALAGYEGTVIAVSHDRYFMKKLATRVAGFDGDAITELQDGFDGFAAAADRQNAPVGTEDGEKISAGRTRWEDAKRERSEQRRTERRIRSLQAEIGETERLIGRLNEEAQGEAAFDHVRLAEISSLVEKAESRLLELYEETDNLNAF